MQDVTLTLHVLAGVVGLAAGPLAACARKSRGLHTVAGWTYQSCVAVLCASTLLLVAADATLWPFVLLAVPTWAAAVAGVVVRRRRRPGWVAVHVQLLLGSYVSFVTAFCVQTIGGLARDARAELRDRTAQQIGFDAPPCSTGTTASGVSNRYGYTWNPGPKPRPVSALRRDRLTADTRPA